MNKESASYNLENDEFILNTEEEEDDYKKLMIRLKDLSLIHI